jgi:pteridine reductase
MTMGTVLITGAAKRIGREIALNLASKGYNIALHYNKSEKEINKLRNEILKKNVESKIYQTDLSVEIEVTELVKKVRNDFFDLNTLINNASIYEKGLLTETENNFFSSIMDINFKAPFILTREFEKFCKKGNIINFLDSRINHNKSEYFIYTLSRKILADLTKMAAMELAPNIRVNGIAPGLILPQEGNKKEDPLNYQKLIDKVPLKEKGDVADIVNGVNYLLESKYLTGEILFIDGGFNLL